MKRSIVLDPPGTNLKRKCREFLSQIGFIRTSGKLSFISISNKFRSQLNLLLDKLKSTETNFIRCIKPNEQMKDHIFEGAHILSQLRCSGMCSVLQLMQQGYPSRVQFAHLYDMYRQHLPKHLSSLDPRLFCKALFKALGLNETDFKFGMTKVFFRPGKFAEFDRMLRQDKESIRQLIAKVQTWLLHARWKKAQWGALSVIKLKNKILFRKNCHLIIQRNIKRYLAMKKFQWMYKALGELRSLQKECNNAGKSIEKLKKDKNSCAKKLKEIEQNIEKVRKKFKKFELKPKDFEKQMKELRQNFEALLKQIEKSHDLDEQERIKAIQMKMEEDKQKKLLEEQKQKEKMKAENQRKTEEQKRLQQEKEDEKLAAKIQSELEQEEKTKELRQQLVEQEKNDRDLALRIAREDENAVEALSTDLQNTSQKKKKNKYDLSDWKYAELRDTINTSCEIELLDACREEFHRRLKVYHNWKQKNQRQSTIVADFGDF